MTGKPHAVHLESLLSGCRSLQIPKEIRVQFSIPASVLQSFLVRQYPLPCHFWMFLFLVESLCRLSGCSVYFFTPCLFELLNFLLLLLSW